MVTLRLLQIIRLLKMMYIKVTTLNRGVYLIFTVLRRVMKLGVDASISCATYTDDTQYETILTSRLTTTIPSLLYSAR